MTFETFVILGVILACLGLILGGIYVGCEIADRRDELRSKQ